MKKNRDFLNVNDLVSHLKESTLKRDNFSSLLQIIQSLVLIPDTEVGDSVWEKLEIYLDDSLSSLGILPPSSSSSSSLSTSSSLLPSSPLFDGKMSSESLAQKVEELEVSLENKNKEIKMLIEAKNTILIEFNSYKNKNSLTQSKLSHVPVRMGLKENLSELMW